MLFTTLLTVDIAACKEIVAHYEDAEVFWITDDLEIDYTDGFPAPVDNRAE